MSFARAVGFLWVASVPNRARKQLERLRQPRYLLGALVALGYMYFVLVRRFETRGPPVSSESASLFLQLMLAGSSLLTVLSAWAFGVDRPSVTFSEERSASGWSAPPLAPWLERAADQASLAYFGKPACYMGEGGSIPFMGMLGAAFPDAQFVITGVIGPDANAHGPNEYLHVPTARRVTASVASLLDAHARR